MIKKPRKKKSAEDIKAEKEQLDEIERQVEEFLPQASASEREYLEEYLRMFRRLKRLISKSYRTAMSTGNSREYYALSTLMSQQREVIADIRTVTDLSSQTQMILENALQPLVRNFGQVLLDGFYHSRKLMMETTKENETQFALQKLDEITREQSKALQMYYDLAASQLTSILMGEPAEPIKKRKKSRG